MIRIALALAAGLLAGAAQCQMAPRSFILTPVSPRPLDVSAPRTAAQAAYEQASAMRAAAFARTSVDRHLDDGRLTGSFGFLCGLQPSRDITGGGQTYGVDPHGRFVGAKLSRAF